MVTLTGRIRLVYGILGQKIVGSGHFMDVRRAITSVRLQMAYAAEQGLDAQACLAGSDIDPAMLHRPGATVDSTRKSKPG